jgi:hypothetical protein
MTDGCCVIRHRTLIIVIRDRASAIRHPISAIRYPSSTHDRE